MPMDSTPPHLEPAHRLGGIPMTFRGRDVASTIGAFTCQYSIKLVVMGKTRQPLYRQIWPGSIPGRLQDQTQAVDIPVADV